MENIRRAARADHKHAVDAYKTHLRLCLACSREAQGKLPMTRCDRGDELVIHLERAARQLAVTEEELDAAWLQDGLF